MDLEIYQIHFFW